MYRFHPPPRRSPDPGRARLVVTALALVLAPRRADGRARIAATDGTRCAHALSFGIPAPHRCADGADRSATPATASPARARRARTTSRSPRAARPAPRRTRHTHDRAACSARDDARRTHGEAPRAPAA